MKRTAKISLCLFLVLALIMGLCACGDDAPKPAGPKSNSIADRYIYAQELLGAGQYAKAAAAFDAVGDYEDAAKLAMYAKAAALGESGQYDAAIDAFNSFGDYKSSADMAVYYRARKEQAKGDYGDAIKRYNKIILFKDSAQRVEECKQAMYEIADSYAEQGNMDDAYYAFNKLANTYGYADSRQRADAISNAYSAAVALEQAGQYQEAVDAYEALGNYEDCYYRAGYCREQTRLKADYDAAVALQQAGKYEEAIAAFEALGDYSDSKKQVAACKNSIKERDYQAAVALQQVGKYDEAVALFEKLGDYSDCQSRITVCREQIQLKADYDVAVALQQAGHYEEAIAAFEVLGDYKDSDEQIKETKYLKAKSLLEKKDYAGAYAIFINLKGYRDVDNLLSTDDNLKAAAAERAAKLKLYKTAGSYVTYGTYPQKKAGNDSTPIEWLVLEYDAKNNRALLISRYGLDCQPYNSSKTSVTWETCSLRTWLNGTFLNKAFSKAEQGAILTTEVDNSKSQGYYSTNGGKNTQDKIFLLSYAEVNKYFNVEYWHVSGADKNTKSRVAPTAYAIAQGASINSSYKTADGSAYGIWWLRSPGSLQYYAAHVSTDGSLGRDSVNHNNLSVRPAFWLDLSGI